MLNSASQPTALIFDLDNTLYPASSNLFDQIDHLMTTFVADLLDMEHTEARVLQKDYFVRYDTTLNGLIKHHNVKPHEFLEYVHNIDLSVVPQNPSLVQALAKIPAEKYVFTNGSTPHAHNVLNHLGITEHFAGFFDIVDADYKPKPALATYKKMLDKFGLDPKNCIMFEDIPRNLEPAHALGMRTVWIKTDTLYAHMGSHQGTPMHSYIHHTIDDLSRWMHENFINNAA